MSFDRQLWQKYCQQQQIQPPPLYWLTKTDSTNKQLWQLIQQHQDNVSVVIAQAQTAGRGQYGRVWQSQTGGLYLSLGLNQTAFDAQSAAHLTLCSGWGIASALRQQGVPVELKWPNDLLLQGCKLGGIKIETRIQQQQITAVVIGVGINWINPVPAVGINLEHYQVQIPSLERLAAITVAGILTAYQQYLQLGIESILPEYLKLLNSLGKQVMVDQTPATVIGVTAEGKLQVSLHSPGASVVLGLSPQQVSIGYSKVSRTGCCSRLAQIEPIAGISRQN